MQRHRMVLKVNVTHQAKILEVVTTPTLWIRDADLTNSRYKIKLGGIVAQYRIYLVLIKCLSYIHSSNSNCLHWKDNVKDLSQILSSSIRKSHNSSNNQQKQTCMMLNLERKICSKETEALVTMTLFLKWISKVVRKIMAKTVLTSTSFQMDGLQETTTMQLKPMSIIFIISTT